MNDPEPICSISGNKDRIMRQNATSTTYYLYDREDRIADYDPSGNLLISYTHGPGIDEPVAMTLNNSTYFYISDIQGSIRAIVDTQGNAVATYQYDVWGTLVSYNGTLAQKNDYLYTGREYDWQTGIYYYRARYYNPELGRFLTRDPAGMVDGPNMYVYVKNSPVNGVDPWGKWVGTHCVFTCGSWEYFGYWDWGGILSCIGYGNEILGAMLLAVGIFGILGSCGAAIASGGLAAALCIASIFPVSIGMAACISSNIHITSKYCLKYIRVCGPIPSPVPIPTVAGWVV